MSIQIDVEECIGCGACVPTCEHDAITLDDADAIAVVDDENCTDCGDCIELCPVDAILEEGAEPKPRRVATPAPPPEAPRPRPASDHASRGGARPEARDSCGCSCDEEFSLLRWRPGKGQLRRKLRSKLGGR